jgi:hypothetical protein
MDKVKSSQPNERGSSEPAPGNSASYRRLALGLATWLFAGAILFWWAEKKMEGALQEQLFPQLWNYATGRMTSVELRFEEPAYLAVGDPIFIIQEEKVLQVGQVAKVFAVESGRPTRAAMAKSGTAAFYPSMTAAGPGAKLSYYSSGDALPWVLQTMLPAEKRARIAGELSAAFENHRAEILAALRPVVEEGLREALLVVEEDLAAALAARREEWSQLGAKYQHEIFDAKIVPLVKQEIWPIVLGHVEPVANEVGQEIWQRASLWRFGWRSAYDKIPLTEQQLARKEWARFLKEEAVPVLEHHGDDFIYLQQEILMDVARNEEVRAAIRESLQHLVTDPELQQLIWGMFREVIVQNPRLRQALERHWNSPQAQQAFQLASERMEPAVGRIAELLFGSAEQGITPEFSRVLRSKVLRKDRRWLLLEPASDPEQGTIDQARSSGKGLVATVRRGHATGVNPFDLELSGSAHAARP